MKTHSMRILIYFPILLLLMAVGSMDALAESVNGYEEMFKILPGGVKQRAINQKEIEHGQKFVIGRQTRKRRDVDFVKPTEVFRLNKKYISISCDALIRTKRANRESKATAVFALLVEKTETNIRKVTKG